MGSGDRSGKGHSAVIKEATASVFAFRVDAGSRTWRLALVRHPRMGEWMPPGGHVEADESPAEAAAREVREETGLVVRLVPGPATPVPDGFPHAPVDAAWWIVEMLAGPDNHTREPHVHLDHVFLAVVEDEVPAEEQHPVAWFTAEEVAAAEGIAEDSRLQAKELFPQVERVIAGV